MENLRSAPGFFGPNLLADMTLVLQILFFLVLSAGVVAQLQGNFKWHRRLQIPVVLLNLFVIIFVMLPTFLRAAADLPAASTQVPVFVAVSHALLGGLAELLSLYCLLAGLNVLTQKIGVLRYWMWSAYTAWTAAIVFGIGVYLVYYTRVLTIVFGIGP